MTYNEAFELGLHNYFVELTNEQALSLHDKEYCPNAKFGIFTHLDGKQYIAGIQVNYCIYEEFNWLKDLDFVELSFE